MSDTNDPNRLGPSPIVLWIAVAVIGMPILGLLAVAVIAALRGTP